MSQERGAHPSFTCRRGKQRLRENENFPQQEAAPRSLNSIADADTATGLPHPFLIGTKLLAPTQQRRVNYPRRAHSCFSLRSEAVCGYLRNEHLEVSERYNVGIHAGIATGAVNTRKLTRHHRERLSQPGSKLCFHGAKLDGHAAAARCTVTLSQDVSLHLFPTGLLCQPKQPGRLDLFLFTFCPNANLSADSAALTPIQLLVCLGWLYSFQLLVCFNFR